MIGFNLLNDLKKSDDPRVQQELIAKAIEELETASLDQKTLATKEDLKDLELRIVSKLFQHTWLVIVSMGVLGVLNRYLFQR